MNNNIIFFALKTGESTGLNSLFWLLNQHNINTSEGSLKRDLKIFY